MHDYFKQELIESLPYETPFFTFSKEKINNKFQEFKEHFPASEIHYAMKANSEFEVLQHLSNADCGFEVASIYELEMLKKIKVAPDKIVFGTSVKAAAHIKQFYEYGVDRFAFDSFSELEKIASVAKGARVFVRVSVNDSASVFKFSEKFGTEKENIVPLLKRAKELGLQPYGISFHVGSQSSNPQAWANAIESIHQPIEQLKRDGIIIEAINLGGGFPCKYLSCEHDFGLKEISDFTLAAYKKLPYHPKLIVEPGRGIIAETGILIVSIIAKVERKENTWLFLDAGVYNGLFEAMSYQGSTRYRVSRLRKEHDAGKKLFALAGPTGDSPDIITREALLPTDTEVGDKLIVHDVGAYSLSVTSEFNGFPKPFVHFI